MPNKTYQILEEDVQSVCEPAVAYNALPYNVLHSNAPNPNIPFHGTQEEWWEYIRDIEDGPFYTIDEANKEFEIWKKNLLASRM